MKPLELTAFLRLKANGANKPKRFQILAYSGGQLVVSGFDKPVVVDLAGLEVPASIPILIDHAKTVEATLGLTDNIHNDGTKLSLQGAVTGQSALSQQVLAQAAAGHTWQASIGVMTIENEEVAAGQTATANGQTFVGPITIARRSVLRETSVLPMGADSTTSVNLAASAAKMLKGSSPMSFEDYVKSLGFDASTLTPEATTALQTAFKAMSAPAAPPVAAAPAPVAAPPVVAPTAAAQATIDLEAALATNRKAIASQFHHACEIQKKAAGFPEIIATAIDNNWSLDKVELEVIKKQNLRTRPTSFSSAQNNPENQGQVIEAALCLRRGVKNTEKQFPDQILQAAHSQYRGRISLQQILLQAAAANGMYVSVGTKIDDANFQEVIAYAKSAGREINAAFSTVSVPGILSNTLNKEILESYMEEDSVWREVFRTASVSDFKTVTAYRMLDDMTYEKLGPGGVIKGGKISEESFTRSVDTYAKMFSLTRRDIINDDLSAFDGIRNNLGHGAAMKLNDLVWETFLGNLATIYTTGRTNYISGSTTNLGADGVGLGLGQKAWRQRTSPTADGTKRVGGMAKFLLVPPEVETIAEALFVGRNNASVKVSDVNTFAGKYTPICAPQLSDSSITGYSTTAWYMFGDKSKGSPIVVSFLNGQETPTVESSDADFSTLGIQFRGYHDFGCDLGDGYLNSLMSKGAA